MANAVLVIDMLRCFMEPGHALYVGDRARGIIPNVRSLLERELAAGSKIFFVCDNHDPDDLEFKMFPPHCVAGTPEAEVIPELAGYPGEIIPKKRYSAFYNTTLEARLKTAQAGQAHHLRRLHRYLRSATPPPTPATATTRWRCRWTAWPPSTRRHHRFALDHMEKVLGARLV